jgi:RNase adapter protein RapZ
MTPVEKSADPEPRSNVVVVTGLSGAGKSTVLAALEDLGYHAIENLPPAVIVHALEACEQAGVRNIALGFGAGVGAFLEGAADALAAIARADGRNVRVLFLDASDEVVLRRFNETRRPHPLEAEAQKHRRPDGTHVSAVLDGARLERERLAPLRAMASLVLDTSSMRVHDLRRRVFSLLAPERSSEHPMSTRLLSFGFKHGLPSDADLVFDVRFLDNPHFVDELRPLTGEDRRVSDYVMKADGAREFLERCESLIGFLLPRYEAEGKAYLTIAIGCTGGQHRSVAIAIELSARLAKLHKGPIAVVHRDAAIVRAEAPSRVT